MAPHSLETVTNREKARTGRVRLSTRRWPSPPLPKRRRSRRFRLFRRFGHPPPLFTVSSPVFPSFPCSLVLIISFSSTRESYVGFSNIMSCFVKNSFESKNSYPSSWTNWINLSVRINSFFSLFWRSKIRSLSILCNCQRSRCVVGSIDRLSSGRLLIDYLILIFRIDDTARKISIEK